MKITHFLSLIAAGLMAAATTTTTAAEVENGPEVAGFRGEVTGQVKSAQEDGHAFILAISKAEVDPASSSLKEGTPLLGKELNIGTRMPKNADGVASPHVDDVAYIKTLKPGMIIRVKIFAPRSSPQVLRIQSPGQSVEGADPSPKGEKTGK